MSESLSVKLKRVCAGDRETKPIGMQGFVAGEIPADGFIVSASVDTVSRCSVVYSRRRHREGKEDAG